MADKSANFKKKLWFAFSTGKSRHTPPVAFGDLKANTQAVRIPNLRPYAANHEAKLGVEQKMTTKNVTFFLLDPNCCPWFAAYGLLL